MSEADRMEYYDQAMKAGLNSRLQVPFFTTVGKLKVKVPKYNSPRSVSNQWTPCQSIVNGVIFQLYSDDMMDEMVSGTSSIEWVVPNQ